MKNVLTLIRLPNLLLMALTQALVVFCLLPQAAPLRQADMRFWLLLFATLCIGAAGYIINDYYDIKIDAINKPGRMVVGRVISRRQAILSHIFLSAIGVLAGAAVSWKVGLVNLGAVLLLWGYSDLLKRLLLVGNVVIALLSAAMLLVVAVPDDNMSLAVWAYAVFAFLSTLIREIIKDMEDVKGDASFDCRTLPIVAGIRGAKWVLYPLLLIFFSFTIAVLRHPSTHLFFDVYMLLLVLGPSVLLLVWLIRADRKRDFTRLSNLSKFIMFAGILSMLLL